MKHLIMVTLTAFALTACGDPDPYDMDITYQEYSSWSEDELIENQGYCYPKSKKQYFEWKKSDRGFPQCMKDLGLMAKARFDASNDWKVNYPFKDSYDPSDKENMESTLHNKLREKRRKELSRGSKYWEVNENIGDIK